MAKRSKNFQIQEIPGIEHPSLDAARSAALDDLYASFAETLIDFVNRIELGYNRARIFYTFPLNDFSHSDEMSRNELPILWGHFITCEKSIQISWRSR